MIERSKILQHEQRLDKYLCYVLVTELIFGAKKLNGDSKPVQCIRTYEDTFKKILAEIQNEKQEPDESTSEQGKHVSSMFGKM